GFSGSAVRRVQRHQLRLAGVLREVELADEVAEQLCVLADDGARVGPAVRLWVEPLAAEEVVFDELQVGVERECLVVDVAVAGPGADQEAGYTQPVALPVDRRR